MKNNKVCYLNVQVQLVINKENLFFNENFKLPWFAIFSNLTIYMQSCLILGCSIFVWEDL